VNELTRDVHFIQVGSDRSEHPRLSRVYDLVGQTTLRQLFDLVQQASGILCGVSLLMHVAAALEKPAVVIAGGREPVAWNAYPKQQYVHTVGALPCRSTQGHVGRACWRSRVVPLGDSSSYDENTCERPIDGVPECMRMIKPEEVASLILRYNHGANMVAPQERVAGAR
jgi:ADP-heptose:LPS heptosyltransferase